MKVQTTAQIETLVIDGKAQEPASPGIDLEFSALDTGGGFKDPILDFSFLLQGLDIRERDERDEDEKHKIRLMLRDPQNEENEAELLYEESIGSSAERINGRLKDDRLSKELIGFVLQLLR